MKNDISLQAYLVKAHLDKIGPKLSSPPFWIWNPWYTNAVKVFEKLNWTKLVPLPNWVSEIPDILLRLTRTAVEMCVSTE